MEQLEQHLADEIIRNRFYFLLDKLKTLMSIASNSNKLCQVFSIEQLNELYQELKNFDKLKKIIEQRYTEKADKKIYTDQIMKLLDEHIIADNIIKTEPINIFNNKMFEDFITRADITDADKANQINAHLQDTINDYININRAFFQKFSELINSTITQHHNKRLSDSEFLNKVVDITNELKKDVSSELGSSKTAIEFYKKLSNFLQNQKDQNQHENAAKIALDTYDIIKKKKIVHWTKNTKIINQMKNLLDDYFFDVAKKKMGINFDNANLNDIVKSLIDLAKEHEAM
ncbi:MAG TPA: DUF3387 domain-containing protein [Rickettsia endosymbiont of Pyrocoelia pectoralis]|nr:DUF3387 domain-containing protein [Rickettsia endosymbiont of Pyrocoelia pectoralis]